MDWEGVTLSPYEAQVLGNRVYRFRGRQTDASPAAFLRAYYEVWVDLYGEPAESAASQMSPSRLSEIENWRLGPTTWARRPRRGSSARPPERRRRPITLRQGELETLAELTGTTPRPAIGQFGSEQMHRVEVGTTAAQRQRLSWIAANAEREWDTSVVWAPHLITLLLPSELVYKHYLWRTGSAELAALWQEMSAERAEAVLRRSRDARHTTRFVVYRSDLRGFARGEGTYETLSADDRRWSVEHATEQIANAPNLRVAIVDDLDRPNTLGARKDQHHVLRVRERLAGDGLTHISAVGEDHVIVIDAQGTPHVSRDLRDIGGYRAWVDSVASRARWVERPAVGEALGQVARSIR